MARAIGIGQGDADEAEPGEQQQHRYEHADRGIKLAGEQENARANHAIGGDEDRAADADRPNGGESGRGGG